jgi:serine/threonine protein kinase
MRPPPLRQTPDSVGPFTLGRRIGTGSFATVYLGEHPPSGIRVAIKAIPVSSFTDDEMRTRFVREVTLMKQMDHPFIGKLYQVIESTDVVYLIQEYVENGTLLAYVNQHERLPELHARRLFTQLLALLEYLHDCKMVMHRDIKAENVLLDEYLNVRLIDFGLSHAFTQSDPRLHTPCGSPAYAAPEMIVGSPYTKAADIWSAGILLYAMVVGELPFDDPGGVRGILMKIVSCEPDYPDLMSTTLVDLLRRILMKSPEARIDIPKIKAHPWFSHSEYLKIFQVPFSEEEWLVRGVDRGIVDEMERMGIDVRGVAESILCGEYTAEAAMYSMLRRKRITVKVHEVMDALTNATVTTISPSHSLLWARRIGPTGERTPSVRRGPPGGARRGSDLIVGIALRRGSIEKTANPLGAPPPPTIVRPRPLDSAAKRPRSGTLQ